MPCRISIDTYQCNSCETCVVLCPDLFRINQATGKAEALFDSAACSDDLDRAVSMCPEKCIQVEIDPGP